MYSGRVAVPGIIVLLRESDFCDGIVHNIYQNVKPIQPQHRKEEHRYIRNNFFDYLVLLKYKIFLNWRSTRERRRTNTGWEQANNRISAKMALKLERLECFVFYSCSSWQYCLKQTLFNGTRYDSKPL